MTIGSREVGPGRPCFVIAEAGVNHNGDPELAAKLVERAADAGADAVKFQTFRADDLATAGAPKAAYQEAAAVDGESQLEMLRRLELDADAHRALAEQARRRGVVFLSSAFDAASVELLDGLDIAAFKVASPDVVNVPLLRWIGAKRRPVILSSGAADLDEVERAVGVLRRAGAGGIVALHCVSAYPAAASDANLRAMQTMADRLGVPIGYSDHTEGTDVALAAAALGACAIEKHFTLDRALPGPDHRASLEPDELGELIRGVRRVESALGDGVKRRRPAEQEVAVAVRRSLAAAEPLTAGTVLEEAMLIPLRPGTGIPPDRIDDVVGRRLRRELARGELLGPADLE